MKKEMSENPIVLPVVLNLIGIERIAFYERKPLEPGIRDKHGECNDTVRYNVVEHLFSLKANLMIKMMEKNRRGLLYPIMPTISSDSFKKEVILKIQ